MARAPELFPRSMRERRCDHCHRAIDGPALIMAGPTRAITLCQDCKGIDPFSEPDR